METIDKHILRRTVLSALFTALIIVGAYISFPLPVSPVPIVLQNLFVLLAGLLLGRRWALGAVALYLLLGLIGLPVFSAARGGLAHFLGPTGGYLIGFLLAAGLAATIVGTAPRLWREIVAVVVGTISIYLIGVPWLKVVADMSWPSALAAGLTPFLIGDALKAAAAVGIARLLRPVLRRRAEG
jgi:biotin transport system substrate-specific component